MIYHFRIPSWYKFTILTIYTLLGTAVLGEGFLLLSHWIKITILGIFGAIGIWILTMWRQEIVLDIEKGTLTIGKRSFSVDEIVDFKITVFRCIFYTRNGVVKFCYPIEDPDVLGRYLRGEGNEAFG